RRTSRTCAFSSPRSVALCEWNGRVPPRDARTPDYSSASLRASNEDDQSSAWNSSSVARASSANMCSTTPISRSLWTRSSTPGGGEGHWRVARYGTGERGANREGVVHADVVETTPDDEPGGLGETVAVPQGRAERRDSSFRSSAGFAGCCVLSRARSLRLRTL